MNDFGFHPVLAEWFRRTIGEPTDVQRQAWPLIAAGKHTLIAAPTGSGKTLAALLPCLNRLVRMKEAQPERPDGVRILYVTPLKALNNDIGHHAVRFAGEMEEVAAELATGWPGITVGVRTGDTSQSTRASMLRHPPDLLITTPESLYLLLTSLKGREMLKTAEQVIIDEIHDLAADKRGLHLTVTLERLVEWCARPIQRIGVSATQKPMERMARYLGGWEDAADAGSEAGRNVSRRGDESEPASAESAAYREVSRGGDGEEPAGAQGGADLEVSRRRDESEPAAAESGADLEVSRGEDGEADGRLGAGYVPRSVEIVESRMQRNLTLTVTMAERKPAGRGEERLWQPILERLEELMRGSRSVLIFVNSRRLCERLTLRLNDYAGSEIARSHHGSVSREKRLEVEELLKSGKLCCLVATSSLELGIDVGHIDLVIQIDSPKSAAAGIQRFGRAGHAVGGTSRGVLLARTRGELPEAAVLARAVAARDIEAIRVPRHALDVLSQQTVAMVATGDWEIGRLTAVFARSDGFRGLPRQRLLAALDVLAGLYPFARPLIEWDREAGLLRRLPGTPMAAVMGAGTIPPGTGYPVHHAETKLHLGELDEEYVYESRVGDVFQLGASSWAIRSIRPDRIYVTESPGRLSEIPFWRAQAGGRSYELGVRIGKFLEELESRDLDDPEVVEWLAKSCFMEAVPARSLLSLVKGQMNVSALPTSRRIVFEHFMDDSNRHHLVIHSLFGRKFNKTWQLALQTVLEKKVSGRFYAGVRDSGIEFVFSEWNASLLSAVRSVTPAELETLLLEALPSSPLLALNFRRIAEVSLLLARGYTRIPSWKRRLRSEELLKDALPYAERFPYLREAMEESLGESLSAPRVKMMLEKATRGEIEFRFKETKFPSPFASEFMQEYISDQFYESDSIGRDLQAQVLGLSRTLAAELFGSDSWKQAVSPSVLAEEKRRLEGAEEPQAGGPDGVYRLLKKRGDMSREELLRLTGAEGGAWTAELEKEGRVTAVTVGGSVRLICGDERPVYASFPQDPASMFFILKRYADHRIAFTPDEMAERYHMDPAGIRELLSRWEEEKLVEPAPFADREREELWTSCKVASRLIRVTLREYEREGEAVPASRYAAYLARLHGLAIEGASEGKPGPPSSGAAGAAYAESLPAPERLRGVLERLQGFYLPVSHWEKIIFPARLPGYRKEDLDLLCASGEVFWAGRKEEGEKEGRVAFFLTGEEGLAPPEPRAEETRHPELLALLRNQGASFLSALARQTGDAPSELLAKLIDLVWEGHAANDQFAPLRLHASSTSRAGRGEGREFRSGLGRWYALGPSSAHEGPPSSAERDPAAASRTDSRERAAAQWVRHLLRAFGLLTRDIAAQFSPFGWDELYPVLRQLEDWGVLTRGFFVRGIPAVQYALKETVEDLRNPWTDGDGSGWVLLSAADPANPYGITAEWPETEGAVLARKPGNTLVFRDGRWVLWLEHGARRMVETEPAAGDRNKIAYELSHVLYLVLKRNGMKKIVIERWNGCSAPEAETAGLFREMGAERDRNTFVLWPSSFR